MRAIIVDDELSNIENLRTLLRKHCPYVIVVGFSDNVKTAAELIVAKQPDLLFLDIHLNKESGFNLLKIIPKRSFEVIFITAFDQYGIQAIKFAALDYLLKPIDIDELIQSVEKATEEIKRKQDSQQFDILLNFLKKGDNLPRKIALPQQKEIRYVSINEIIRCEADNAYTFFFLTNGDKVLVSRVLKEYDDLLHEDGFLRTHQSHLVNIAFIKSWLKEDGGTLLLSNGDRVPVSKPNKDTVRKELNRLSA